MAANLLIEHQSGADLRLTSPPVGVPLKPMNRESQVRSVAVLLFLLTVAAVVFAVFNFKSELKFLVPDDGAWSKATYSLLRQSVPLDSSVILEPAERSLNNWLRVIALIYLGIGLYVLLRRWTAPGSTHFYIFCLVSFIAYSFKYTGKLNDFDWTIYWGNIAAGVLQPALFLHFVLTFPERRQCVRQRPWSIPLLYVPGMLLLVSHALIFKFVRASER